MITMRGVSMDQAMARINGGMGFPLNFPSFTTSAGGTVTAPAAGTRVAAADPFYKQPWFWVLVALGGGFYAWKKFGKKRSSPLG